MTLAERITNFGRRKAAAGPPPLEDTDSEWKEAAEIHDAALAELDELRRMAAAYDERAGVRANPTDPFKRQLAERVSDALDAFAAAKEVMDLAWHRRHRSWLAEARKAAAETTARHLKENASAYAAYDKAKRACVERTRDERVALERRIDAERSAA